MGYILHRQYETSQNSCHHFSLSICLLYGLCANNLSLFIYTNIIPQIYWYSFVCVPQNYNAKISDFGLAKFGPTGEDSHVSTRVMGTFVYAAPEYMATGDYIYTKCLWKYLNLFDQKKILELVIIEHEKQSWFFLTYLCGLYHVVQSGHLYVKSDVYGFGVVLLEMLTGLQALDTKRPVGKQNLVIWTKPSLSNKRKLKSIMDAGIEDQYSPDAALRVGQLILTCLEPDPKKRPSMIDVLETLEGIEAIKHKRKISKKHCT